MKMQKLRLADMSLIYHIKDLMISNGFSVGSFDVLDSYPDNLDSIAKFPCITVQSNVSDSVDIQLGSRSTLNITWVIDVFAKGDGQRDDVSYIIWDDLNESGIKLYDFNTGLPSTPGDYSGISTLGTIFFGRGSISVIEPETFTKVIAEKHHNLVIISGYLSI